MLEMLNCCYIRSYFVSLHFQTTTNNPATMTLREKIAQTLRDTHEPNIDKLLHYMEENGFYSCHCASHDHWEGGTSQHVWAVYLIAKALRDKRIAEPAVAKYATDRKLAIVCLLHDLCDMNINEYGNYLKKKYGHHGGKSYWIIKKFGIGTHAEQEAVCYHMYSDKRWTSGTPDEVEEYNALHSLVSKADKMACGTAWNSTRYKEGRTQKTGSLSDNNYLRAVTLDRTVQGGNCHLYVDEQYELREYRNFNRDNIGRVACEDIDSLRKNDVLLDDGTDAISAAHEYTQKTGKRLCLVVGGAPNITPDKSTRLRQGYKGEQDLLICSNILNSFYTGKTCREKGTRRYRYEFTMRDEIKELYSECAEKNNCLYLPKVLMIRDGEKRGFPFVEPWTVDILLVLGGKFDTFAVSMECSDLLKSQKK